MKKHAQLILLVLSFFLFAMIRSGVAADSWIGMVTGSKTGTYIKIGQDIADAARMNGVDIRVQESEGSLDNIKRMNSRENAGFGIVQSDVLGYMRRSDSPQLRKVAERLRMVFPLYNEEVHVFAATDIRRLSDLNGRTVSVGSNGGGSWMTAMNLFKMLNIQPARVNNWDNTKAAAAVIDGNLDAMIYVAGKPVTFFEKVGMLKNDPAYKDRFNRVHFVAIDESEVLNEYVPSSIGPNDYSWIDEKVPTVAVKAVMVSYDFSSRRNSYYNLRCDQLGKISQALYRNIEDLKSNGLTPKWREVDLSATIGNWPKDKCSLQPSAGKQAGEMSTEEKLEKFFN
ncbi:conserved hypothetical protein [Desulfosarcina cetonica]|uniref:TAXI family TRAP transporter solute-binding subunit n=1 Tax=Desulfosarcina cetonica TaxID=90730 RepID=UPI0006D12C13|nr:TAXI family TRAP transporter solute-binding subunit [Desulfosarcina cetonica]VTR64387.1 conserved hypothetical protein [Desulfosarcina cetonica]